MGQVSGSSSGNLELLSRIETELSEISSRLDNLRKGVVLTVNSANPKTDKEIDSFIASEFVKGIRRLKILNEYSTYRFGEQGNFNFWLFGENQNELTGIVINHWNGNMFSARYSNGEIKITKFKTDV